MSLIHLLESTFYGEANLETNKRSHHKNVFEVFWTIMLRG